MKGKKFILEAFGENEADVIDGTGIRQRKAD